MFVCVTVLRISILQHMLWCTIQERSIQAPGQSSVSVHSIVNIAPKIMSATLKSVALGRWGFANGSFGIIKMELTAIHTSIVLSKRGCLTARPARSRKESPGANGFFRITNKTVSVS